jgi:hypothetical protein
MQHALALQIADELTAAAQKAWILDPLDRAANIPGASRGLAAQFAFSPKPGPLPMVVGDRVALGAEDVLTRFNW